MVNNMDHGLPKFSLLGYDDWKIMMEAHLYALHDCMWMVLEDGPLKIQMENPERNPTNPDVVQYIPKPKEKWDDRDCKKHNLDNVAKAAIFKTLDPITFSKIKHLKTAMEIWQGLGKLCEGSEDLRKQKMEVLLEKFKSFKMLPGESFDMLDERFHKILNHLASLNHVLSPKEKIVRLLRSLPTEWYTKATAMEEGRNQENYTVQGLLDELKKKKEEQVTPFPTALMTTPRVPTSEGTCPRNCDTPSSSQPLSSKMENYDEEFAMMVKQFRKFKKKPGHWKSACSYPKVEKYGERERNEKKKKAMVAAKSDESSSSSSDEEALVCMERRAKKSNHEDRWTMLEDDTLSLMAKDDADQEVTSQTSCSSSYESIPTSENLFNKFKKMMKDFEEINLKHSSLTEENKLLSEENLKLTEGRKSQLNEITQLKAENESLTEKVKSLNKELGILKSKEAVNKLLETTKHKGREGLGFDPSSSKRKGRTTFIPPKPTAKPNKQKGKEKEKPTEVPKKEAAKYPGVWYLDSGCSRHMTGDASLLRNLIPYDGPRVTFGGSNDYGLTKGLGNLMYKGLTIQAVSYVEGLNYNLLSISQFCDKGYSLEFCKDMASLKNISTNEVILTGKRIRNIYEVMWDDVKDACLISKADTNLLWLWHKRLSHLNFKTLNKLSKEGLVEGLPKAVYKKESICDSCKKGKQKNGKIKAVQSKKNPQRTIQVIKSTVGRAKIKISQKKLEKKLHLPNSGSEIGRLSPKNLDWKTIGISGQIPSGPAKKADLKNDYKLILELVIACLECGSGGHADDITQERAFIINALITRTKVNWAKHFFNSVSKHLGKPKQKYLCQGLYLGYTLESMGVASEGKKYDARYWLYYLSSKGENKASSTAEDESSSDNVLIMSLKKSSKRKHVVSPSPSAEAPQNLALVNLDDEEEEVPAHGELQKMKKGRISSSSTSGSANLDDLVGKELVEETSAHNQSPQQLEEETPQLYYDWRAWKVGNSTEQLLGWDQQLKNEKMIKRCLGLPVNHCCEQILDVDWVWQRTYEDLHQEHLATSPISEFEVDDEETAVYRPIFSKATEDQMVLTTEAQANMEAIAEDFQVFPENFHAFETVLPEAVQENAASPQQEQNKEASEEELLQLLQTQVQEILTTSYKISKPTELEIPEKSTEILKKSTPPETTANETQEDPAIEVQRSFAETEEEAEIATLEATENPVAIFEQQNEDEDRDSLSRDISNFVNNVTEEESEKTLKIDEEEAEQGDAESLPLQLFHKVPSSHQVTNFHFHSSSTSTLPDEVPETWTRKVQGLIESALDSQHASFRQEIEQMEERHTKLMEKSEEKYCSNLNEISKSVDKTLEIISLLSKSVSNTMEAYASDCHLQFKEVTRIKEQIATVTVNLQKQMSSLQMDIRSALAVSSANQVVTKDYLKVIAENQKEAFKLFRHFGTYTGKHKLDVTVQHRSPSQIPQLPIVVKQGELTYIPSNLDMTDLILEAQQRNPENSIQHLSDTGLDGTEAMDTSVLVLELEISDSASSTTTPVAIATPLSASKATTLSGGGAIAKVAAKETFPIAAVRSAAAAAPAVLTAGETTGVPTRQQRRAAGSAKRSPLPIEEEEGRPHLKKTRHGILKLEKRALENGVKLEPFIVVVGDGSNRAVEITLKVEPPCKKKEETAPLFVVWLRKAELNWNMEFNVGDGEIQMWRFLGGGLRGDLTVGHCRGGEKLLAEKEKEEGDGGAGGSA
ncbi:unnamed protein product [Cuscuta campestris]|uniref:Uncharacterized protein n=1 Tax=Cuscuta campestris TaxID=132261 RepID=A0A484KQM3_9ASTE|nr:unnamed protein product [Cuscuta campestris]